MVFLALFWSYGQWQILVINFSNIWSFRLYGQLYQDKTVDHKSETRCSHNICPKAISTTQQENRIGDWQNSRNIKFCHKPISTVDLFIFAAPSTTLTNTARRVIYEACNLCHWEEQHRLRAAINCRTSYLLWKLCLLPTLHFLVGRMHVEGWVTQECDITVALACKVHRCKVSPLVWLIFGQSL